MTNQRSYRDGLAVLGGLESAGRFAPNVRCGSAAFMSTRPKRTAASMKSFLTTAVIVSITGLGLGQSAAQTDTSSPGSIGATSPLGADFGQTSGNSPTGMPSPGGIGATSPLGADFGQPPGDNSQSAEVRRP